MADIQGTEAVDTLRANGLDQRLIGRGGNDTLVGGLYQRGTVMIGGTGSDTYTVEAGLMDTVIILENGNDPADRWVDKPINVSINQIVQIDGRHLLMNEAATGRSVLFLDWQTPENIIEHWDLLVGTTVQSMSFTQFRSAILSSAAYIGDVRMEVLGTAYATALRAEIDGHYAVANAATTPVRDVARQMLMNGSVVTPETADGSFGLQWKVTGRAADDIVVGTSGNDLINAIEGSDAVDGAAGNDIIDGGAGSNFLTGSQGQDRFFVDGRGSNGAQARTVWSTITDLDRASSEQVTVWGWQDGTSRIVQTTTGGATGYQGVTWHLDLTGDGTIDASVTLTGLSASQVAVTYGVVDGNGYMLIG